MKRITDAIRNAPDLSDEFKSDAVERLEQDSDLAFMARRINFKAPEENYAGEVALQATTVLTPLYFKHEVSEPVARDLFRDMYTACGGLIKGEYETR